MRASDLKQGLLHLVVYLKMTVLLVQQVGISAGMSMVGLLLLILKVAQQMQELGQMLVELLTQLEWAYLQEACWQLVQMMLPSLQREVLSSMLQA